MNKHLTAAQVSELAELLEDAPERVGVIDRVLQAAAEGRGMTLRLVEPAREQGRQVAAGKETAGALLSMAAAELQLGQPGQAIEHCQRSLAISRDIGDLRYEGEALHYMAEAHRRQCHYDLARRCYQQALGVRRDIGDRHGQAETLTGLGSTLQATGEPHAASQALREALAILADLGDPGTADIHDRIKAATSPVNLDTTTRSR